jgi:hypothetical protein
MPNTRLTRTPSSAGNRKTFTISLWFQISGGGDREIIGQTSSSYFRCMLKSDDTMRIYDAGFNFITNRKFTDRFGFYHLVVRVDTTQSTANDRVRVYINGVDERTVGGYSTDTAPSQNQDLAWNTTSVHQIGGHSNNYDYFNGVISHIHHCDSYSYAPTEFGETDSTTGEWKIKTSPSVSYGTNGFFILKDGNSVTDQSGQGNNFTVASGTLTKTESSPSNVFATLNPLANIGSASTYANGNTTITGGSDWGANPSTVATGTTGKYYAECKVVAQASSYSQFGIMSVDAVPNWTLGYVHTSADAIVWSIDHRSGQSKIESNNSSIIQTPTQFSDGDIIGMAIDVTNGKIYFHRNGTYVTYTGYVQNPSSGTYGITLPTSTSGYHIMGNVYPNAKISVNFGNGYFGSTQISSAGTNASGNGIFEYDVPTGYTALSTKGLNL